MTETSRSAGTGGSDPGSAPGIPGWLKLLGMGLLIVVLLVAAMMLAGGGHAPPPGAH